MKLLTQIEKHVFGSIGFPAKMWINPLTTSIIQGMSKSEVNDVHQNMRMVSSSFLIIHNDLNYDKNKKGKQKKSHTSSHYQRSIALEYIILCPDYLNLSVEEKASVMHIFNYALTMYVDSEIVSLTSNLPPGAVIESKSQLVGIRDRVRADTEVTTPAVTSAAAMNEEGKRIFSAANPDPKDAADLLRMCVQCGIPKTYSHARGVVCPVCGDRPLADAGKESEKKKGSTMKDKEKSKRLKGQSSHATWKSETEMHLRQQYD
ncbi:hypothetical protein KSP40_PGU007299 [Platanthera guangdongensis]|uniref:Uncharacterized protein n=1 Tax=Platanthera guangdongensis TaxID=2320717 RepID=A0ABR2MYY1_9ASPA